MCCCHGYRHAHHWCFGPGPGYEYGPPPDLPYPPYRQRGRRTRARDLEDYLEDLEDELARVRLELQRKDTPSGPHRAARHVEGAVAVRDRLSCPPPARGIWPGV